MSDRVVAAHVALLLTRDELRALFTECLAEHLANPAPPIDPDAQLDCEAGAKLLSISRSKFDRLRRREEDPIPQSGWAGESPRFDRRELLAWLRRQPKQETK